MANAELTLGEKTATLDIPGTCFKKTQGITARFGPAGMWAQSPAVLRW